ncbi:MAG: hypothetical protein LUG60_14295 [Erysipelotrichaceae bacterium]|nr:hypothetical protein [Erysipelotrichaceae bacterium]
MKLIIQHLLNFFHKIHIHYTTIIYIFISLIIKQFVFYLLALFLVLIHELAHYLMACYLNYAIDKIEILPFGAFLSLNDIYEHSMIEEACVIMAGPCTHLFIYLIIQWFPLSIYHNYLLMMNKLILLFNLLPIYPLDGGRLVGIILELFIDLKTAFYFHLKLSILSLCILSVFYLRYQTFIIIIYLLIQQMIYYHYIPIYLRLFYTYMNQHSQTIIHTKLKFRRDYINYYYLNGHLYTQQQVLINLMEKI